MVRDRKITEAQASAVEAAPFSRYVISPAASTGVTNVASDADAYFISAVRQQLYAKYGQPGGRRGRTPGHDHPGPGHGGRGLQRRLRHEPRSPEPGGRASPPAALVSMDNNGEVKALIGGQDYATVHGRSGAGKAGGGSGRQAGSTFKAFMLAELLKAGYSPTVGLPGPAGGRASPRQRQRHAVVGHQLRAREHRADHEPGRRHRHSVNTVYAQVVDRLGPANLDSMAEALGINPAELPGRLSLPGARDR